MNTEQTNENIFTYIPLYARLFAWNVFITKSKGASVECDICLKFSARALCDGTGFLLREIMCNFRILRSPFTSDVLAKSIAS